MSAFTPTPEQSAAIGDTGNNLIVSAAAGSGKTTILCKRILKKLTEGAQITRLLIVTFTRDSAADLRAKLHSQLSEELGTRTGERHLQQQLYNIPNARISTMDSFCSDIARRGFRRLGLPAAFRTMDAAETSMLEHHILSDLLDDCYDNSESAIGVAADDFLYTIDNIIGFRSDDALMEVISDIYELSSRRVKKYDWLEEQISSLRELERADDIAESSLIKQMAACVRAKIEPHLPDLEEAREISLDDSDKWHIKYYTSIDVVYTYIKQAYSFLTSETIDYSTIPGEFFSPPSYIGVGRQRGLEEEKKAFMDAVYKSSKELVDDLIQLLLPPEKLREYARKNAVIAQTLLSITAKYDESLMREKKKRCSFSFADIERFALDLLVTPSGELTPDALHLRDEFDEVYIDEYQDINPLQDLIFTSVSKTSNRFMVGDVKQSIYSFRGSDPSIFMDYMSRFTSQPNSRSLVLSSNFRSRPNILSFCNGLFEHLFSRQIGGIDYANGHYLSTLKKPLDMKLEPSVDIYYIKPSIAEASSDESAEAGGDPTPDESCAGDPNISRQADFVARYIKGLLIHGDKSIKDDIKPGDITILLRTKSRVTEYMRALRMHGVPCFSEITDSFFECPEIELAVSLLYVVDNPQRDIHLAAVLRSPIFGITLTELVELRHGNGKTSIYDLLTRSDNSRYTAIADTILRWRANSHTAVDRFIWYLYAETGIINLLGAHNPTGDTTANLLLLYQYARSFESTSFKGVYSFLEYITNAIKGDVILERAKSASGSIGAVNIRTVHKSKGLEFPICIYAQTQGQFNQDDANKGILINENSGVLPKLADKSGIGKFTTPFRVMSAEQIRRQTLSEEARILYVALTRAADKLVIVGAPTAKTYAEKHSPDLSELHTYNAAAKSHFDWIYGIYNALPELFAPFTGLREIEGSIEDAVADIFRESDNSRGILELTSYLSSDETKPQRPNQETLMRRYSAMYDFKYPRKTDIPAKLTVSSLHPGILDDYADIYSPENPSDKTLPELTVPQFIRQSQKTPAQRGIAQHTFMQFASFENCIERGSEAEASRLLEKRYINKSQYDLLDHKKLNTFFSSPLCEQIMSADKIYREWRFNLRLPAEEFTQSAEYSAKLEGEFVLIQGVIDLFYIKDEDVCVVDFKTDGMHSSITPEQLISRHSRQIGYYARAVREITGAERIAAKIYSFGLDGEVVVDCP